VTLPSTGSNVFGIVFWAALMLVFGRITMLAARPHRVIPTNPKG